MIVPTIGRIVYYKKKNGDTLPAIVTKVHSDRCVNLEVFGMGVSERLKTAVELCQPGDVNCPALPYCEWMPYQIKKEYGSESGEPEAGEEVISGEGDQEGDPEVGQEVDTRKVHGGGEPPVE